MTVASVLMRPFERSHRLRALGWFGYAVAVAGGGLALGVRLGLGEAMPGYPYVTFFPVVVLTTFFGGVRPGVFSAVFCGLLAWYFVMPPGPGFQLFWPSTYLALGFYAFVVAVNIALIDAMEQALRELGAAQRTTTRLLEEQRTLFNELQHRVANNMAFVASLLGLQKRKLDPDGVAAAALEDARARIFVMERIHRRLYDPQQVEQPAGPYLEALCRDLLEASGRREVACRVGAVPMVFSFERLVTLSMLLSELLNNALKHAFEPGAAGRLEVTLREPGPGLVELAVRDDGRGLPAGFDPESGSGLGSRIVQGLVARLGGTIDWRPAAGGRGTEAVVRFSAEAARPAPTASGPGSGSESGSGGASAPAG